MDATITRSGRRARTASLPRAPSRTARCTGSHDAGARRARGGRTCRGRLQLRRRGHGRRSSRRARRSRGRPQCDGRRRAPGRRWSMRSGTWGGPASRRWRSRRWTTRSGISRRGCWTCPWYRSARRRAGCGAGLRQRRLHVLFAEAAAVATRRLGGAGHPPREDEDRAGIRRPTSSASGRRAPPSAPSRSCSWTRTAPTVGSRPWPSPSDSGLRVSWLEEPVSSDDLDGLRLLRDRAPAGMDVTAGEYGYDARYFRRMLEAGAVDVLQADATRCGGITGFMDAAALCDGVRLPLSSHCAPSIHAHAGCAARPMRHMEYFADHVRIERHAVRRRPRPSRRARCSPTARGPGSAYRFKRRDAQRYAA